VGVLLRQAREDAGLTQEEVARRLETQKSAISRIENHAGPALLAVALATNYLPAARAARTDPVQVLKEG
jgi:cytoskeletal protein RodZ